VRTKHLSVPKSVSSGASMSKSCIEHRDRFLLIGSPARSSSRIAGSLGAVDR
jgi:hypothetical protein